MYTVLRRYRVRLGTVAQAAAHAEETLLPLLKRVPGFGSYYLLDTGNNIVAVLALFETRDGAGAAVRLLSDWFRSDWPAFRQIPPDVAVGELLSFEESGREAGAVARESEADRTLAAATEQRVSERRINGERRVDHHRRIMKERRERLLPPVVERRTAGDRRTSAERRSGVERRADWATVQFAPAPPQRRIAPPMRRRQRFPTPTR